MKKVVIGWGRMNPSTTGHELVAKSLAKAAKSRGAVARLYLSHTTNPKKDPLSYEDKIKFAKLAFGRIVNVINSRARTIIEVMKELEKEKFTDVTLVVGSDRIREFETLLNRYNGKDFNMDSIEVISAGERDPDAEDVSGMSASKMRGFAKDNDFDKFKEGVPSALNNTQAKQMFDAVRKGMRLTEGVKMNEALSMQARRKRAMQMRRYKSRIKRAKERQMKRFASPEILKRRARRAAVKFLKRRFGAGKAYQDLSVGQKIAIDKKVEKMKGAISKISGRLLPRVRKAEIERRKRMAQVQQGKNEAFESFFEGKLPQDKDIASKSGTQPAKYYKGLDKDTKEKRDAHFKTMGPKSDSDQSAYADAPGDKEAREKGMPQSKHTKKFKQMYGEEVGKKEMSRLDQLVRMGLADKKMLQVIKRGVSKLESGEVLNPNERQAAFDLLQTLLDMTLSQDQLFRMTRTSLQKEEFNEVFEDVFGLRKALSPITHAKSYGMAKDALQGVLARKKDSTKDKLYYASQVARTYAGVDAKKLADMTEKGEYDDYEDVDGLEMAQIEVSNLIQDAEELLELLDMMDEEPEAWVLSKITKATDYIQGVKDYLEFEGMYDYDDYEDDEDEDEMEFTDDEMYEAILEIPREELTEEEYEEFKDLYEEIEGLKKKAEKSGIAYSILKKVYDRGMAAWQGGHRPGTTPQQWAFARVNSFITKGKGTWGGADSDLASKVKKNEEFANFIEALEYGTDELRLAYARATPGQSIELTTAKYSANAAIKVMNNANMQRIFKLHSEEAIHEAIDWHVDNNVPLFKDVYSEGSENYFGLFREARKLYNEGKLELCDDDKALIVDTDIGEFAEYEGKMVPLDYPMCEEEINEAEYQGKDVKLNDPFRTPGGPKKFAVYTMGPNGKVVIVRFGDPNMEIKRDDPDRRSNFRARHNCDDPGPKYKARYWSCYQWRSGAKVDS
jgi:nicotinic acid mononucleotide adenylyltransferase